MNWQESLASCPRQERIVLHMQTDPHRAWPRRELGIIMYPAVRPADAADVMNNALRRLVDKGYVTRGYGTATLTAKGREYVHPDPRECATMRGKVLQFLREHPGEHRASEIGRHIIPMRTGQAYYKWNSSARSYALRELKELEKAGLVRSPPFSNGWTLAPPGRRTGEGDGMTPTGWGDIPATLPCSLPARGENGKMIKDASGKCHRCPGTVHLQPADPGLDWHESKYRCDVCGHQYMPWYPRDGYMRRINREMAERGEI